MTYIHYCLRLLFVSQFASLLAFAGKLFHSPTVWTMFLALLEIFSFFHATSLFVCYRPDDALDGFNVYSVGGFIIMPLLGRMEYLEMKFTKLILDYFNVQAVF